MNLVLTQNSIEYAKAMSAALWSLAHPNRGPSDTLYAVGWIQHPTTGQVALRLGDYEQRVDENADVGAFVNALPLPADEAETLRSTLNNAKGTRLTVAEWLPLSLAANALTDEQMRADGWYGNDSL